MEDAFPAADPGAKPFGNRVLVQMRSPKHRTEGGLYIPEESRDQERWMTTIAKVIEVGPLAFRDRTSMEAWPEGVWAQAGDFVRVPKWGGDRWAIKLGHDVEARYVIYRDTELMAKITGDPLVFKDYV
jgi:co-chaperonin GroES (HSP10)